MANIEDKLAQMGVTLGTPSAPAANYVPFVRSGDMVYVSGQISRTAEGLITGKLGADVSVEDGAAAAQTCAVQLLEQV
ncbi:MAG: RidA family protein, partial [Shimia sp.]